MGRAPVALGLCTALLASSVAPHAFAQSDSERAASRTAAEAGAKAFDEGRYQEAVDYFERAERLWHAPTLLLHLARSLVKLGQYVRAREAYIKVTREQLPPNAPPAFVAAQASARVEIEETNKKIANLTVEVSGAPREALRLTIDGQPLHSDMIGLPAPIDPGTHTVSVTADGYEGAQGSVTLKEGGSEKLTLAVKPLPKAAAAPPPATPAAPPTRFSSDPTADAGAGSGSNGMRIAGYVGIGVGVVGVGLGTLFLIQRGGKQSDADDVWDTCVAAERNSTVCNDPAARKEAQDLDDDAASKGTLALISYAGGGVAAAAGITLLVLSGSQGSSSSAGVRPYFTGNSAGVIGRF